MSSYRQILYHIVFRTKNSQRTINQQEYHKNEAFEEELKRLLEEFGIEYDEKYFP